MMGESILSPGGMGEIRSTMGVCPQFDVLWNDLTAREHLLLFASIKGLATKELVQNEADRLLKEVRILINAIIP
jgi:ABC-type multidrug transport system ATPase subunit